MDGQSGVADLAGLTDWRLLDGRACAWFDTPSHAASAALVTGSLESAAADLQPEFDLRARGVRVRLRTDPTAAREISELAAQLGLSADPSALQEFGWVIETADRPAVEPFWQAVLDYRAAEHGLSDPLRRDPAVRFGDLADQRPLRNRLHLDVGRPADAVGRARSRVGQQPYGPWEVALADTDGNEVDLCPGSRLSPASETSDWQTMFSALAFYPTTSPGQAVALAAAAAEAADSAGLPLLIDLRPEGVMIDSGKDEWEGAGGPDPMFVELAGRVQQAARDLDLSADPTRDRFVQVGIDAGDVPALREFWRTVLGYRFDPRPGVTDIYDPRRLNPVIFFQGLDPADADRHRQRNRLHIGLTVPADRVQPVIDTVRQAGGRIVDDGGDDQLILADPEGNEIRLSAS
ncbi:MAG: hypothetical protein J2P23_10225 [Microlunatus sp.]|nr:hypothetical protein [Microlunatus sp.]